MTDIDRKAIQLMLMDALKRNTISEFQYKVYLKLIEIPKGKVTTYKNLADALKCRSSQAIGQVLKKNRFAPSIPCHRVVRSNLSIGGFCGTLKDDEVIRKISLLQEEGIKFEETFTSQKQQSSNKINYTHSKRIPGNDLFSTIVTIQVLLLFMMSSRKGGSRSSSTESPLFTSLRPLLPQFRAAVGSKVTDEALLTYLAKAQGNVDHAIERFKRGPWGLVETSKFKAPKAVSEITFIPTTETTNIKESISSEKQPTRIIPSSALSKYPQRTDQIINKTTTSFTSSGFNSSKTVFGLGSFITDVTSSLRLGSELSQSSVLPVVEIQFGISAVKRRSAKGAKLITSLSSSTFDSQLVRIKESVSAQLLLNGKRHIGRLAPSAASTLGSLVHADLIQIKPELVPDSFGDIGIGTSIPVTIFVYATPKGLNAEPFPYTLTPQAQSVIRDAWVDLLLGHLNLRPKRPSLFWSSPSNSTSTSPLITPSLSLSRPSTPPTPLISPSSLHDIEVEVVENTTKRQRYVNDLTKDEELEEEEEMLDTERAVERTEELFGASNENVLDSEPKLDLHPAVFRSSLRNYQLQGVQWMRLQELQHDSTAKEDTSLINRDNLHPMWDEFEFLPNEEDGKMVTDGNEIQGIGMRPKLFYFNRTTGMLSLSFVESSPQCRGGILADEMGLGKTVQAIALFSLELVPSEQEKEAFKSITQGRTLREDSEEFRNFLVLQRRKSSAIKRHLASVHSSSNKMTLSSSVSSNLLHGGTLIILPLSLISQWKSEINTHLTPDICKVTEYYGPDRPRDPISLTQSDIVVTSYGTVASEFVVNMDDNKTNSGARKKYSPLWLIRWRRIVLDEAHFIKSHVTRMCRAICSLNATYRWCLTGTPIQNSVEDLYSLLHFLQVDPWGAWVWWSKLVLAPLQKKHVDIAVEAVRRITLPLMLRRTKKMKDSNGKPIVELPSKNEHVITIALSEQEREFYEAVFHRASTEFDQLIQTGEVLHQYTHILELLLRLRQTTCHPLLIYSGSSTKVLKHFGNVTDLTAHFLRGTTAAKNSSLTTSSEINELFLKRQLAGLQGDKELDECPICFEIPDDPGILPCCHILCRGCALNALKSSGSQLQPNQQLGYPCPICRVIFTRSNIAALPGATRMSKRVVKCLFDQDNEFRYSSKLAVLKDFLENDVKSGRHSVVFSQWTSFLDVLEVMLNHLKISFNRFDGTLNIKQRQSVISWFSSNPSDLVGKVLLVSLKSGGVGLNLTIASRCYIMDPWWNPAVEEQAIQRIHRIGQTQEVEIYRLITEKTIEERIVELQKSKDIQAKAVLENEEIGNLYRNAKLGLDDLRNLFKKFN